MAQSTDVSWPTCEHATCIGIRLAPGRMCLAHANSVEQAAALLLVGETGAIDARGVPITGELLVEVLAAGPRGSDGEILVKACRFDRATFSGDANFHSTTFSGAATFRAATFSGDANFHSATFSEKATFDEATFSGDANFHSATFSGNAPFDKAAFNGDANFHSATFSGYALFREAAFSVGVSFGEATFSGGAEFGEARFGGDVSFGTATFSGGAKFDEARFGGDVSFGMATFSGDAGFGMVTFSGGAAFELAKFGSYTWFDEATFSGAAAFGGATFRGDATFDEATFSGAAAFGGGTFGRLASFKGTTFEQAREFGPLLAYRGLVLDDVQFKQPVHIEVSTIGLCCRRARFPAGVQFRLRWARVVLDDTDFPAPSILTGIPRLASEELATREERMARNWQQVLAGEISAQPQLLSLQRANVAGLGLSSVTVADCWFAGAHNLDKLRLEAGVSFDIAPTRLSWDWREVIAEERAWRASRSRHWTAPRWPPWLDDQQPADLEAGQIAGLYRALRKGREDIKDEPGAADFYYGEMEMRRHARPSMRGGSDGRSSGTSRGRFGRGVLTAYWMVSGYGLRVWRALACLAAVTAIFAVAFHLVGFANPPRPVSYWTSLLYAFRATLSLTDAEVTLTAWGKLLQGLLRLTGPVLLGLALLALRGRVKR